MAHARYRISTSWWLKPYVYFVAAMSVVTGREPDWRRVERVSARAVKVKAH